MVAALVLGLWVAAMVIAGSLCVTARRADDAIDRMAREDMGEALDAVVFEFPGWRNRAS